MALFALKSVENAHYCDQVSANLCAYLFKTYFLIFRKFSKIELQFHFLKERDVVIIVKNASPVNFCSMILEITSSDFLF